MLRRTSFLEKSDIILIAEMVIPIPRIMNKTDIIPIVVNPTDDKKVTVIIVAGQGTNPTE
jgi:hypothetical protein